MPTLQFEESSRPPKPLLPRRKQLLNHIIDGIAHVRPEQIWAKVPRSDRNYADGYRKITYRLFANAINGMAFWLEERLGKAEDFPTVAYFGLWDPRYIILLLGAIKAGFKVVFPSPTYGITGLLNLLERLDCQIILHASGNFKIISQLKEQSGFGFHEVPTLSTFLEGIYPHYAFQKTFETSREDPFLVVHTSGTTGNPKPLVYTHDWTASWIQQNQLTAPEGFCSIEHLAHGVEVCAIGPPNHVSNLFPNLFGAIPNDMVVLFPLPDAPYNTDTLRSMIEHNNPSLIIAPPHVITGVAQDAALLQSVLSRASMIGFGGGPLSPEIGSTLTERFRLWSIYGTSETGLVHKITPSSSWDREAWNSIMPHPRDNIEFRPVSGDAYEAVVVRNEEFEEEQPVFKIYTDLREWSTRDIFRPDPYREGFWIYQGRIDDIIILANGNTVNPLGYEQKLSQHPLVIQAIMYGSGRPQPALIVELEQSERVIGQGHGYLLEQIWSAITTCNDFFPPQASVSSSHVLFTMPDKPLPRAPKGAVQRPSTFKLYQRELDKLYDS
ncbi:MAG: hypothetical protein M1820_010697 [Bogoriella megaspora]|nr:MAG: hypothetical protein M1820_010697 [Bogoriella megaspora]